MSELPDGWELISLGTLIELNPKTNDVEDRTEVGFVPMTLLAKSWLSVPGFELRQWASVKKGYTHFRDGDVLLAKITPCFENGKAGLVKALPNGIGSGSTEYFVCRTSPYTLDSRYLLAYLKTDDFVRTGAMSMTGSVGHKRVPKEYLLGRQVPLAPRNEQTRIANQLDTLLTRVQACNDRFDAIPALLKRFRQTVLDAATTGQLTDDWRIDKLGNVTGEEIVAARLAIAGTRPTKAASEFFANHHPATPQNGKLPGTWLLTHIGMVGAVSNGSTPSRQEPSYWGDGIPWVSSGEVANNVIRRTREQITDVGFDNSSVRLLPRGAVLMAMIGEGKTRGQSAILDIDACINQNIAGVVPVGGILDSKYLWFWFRREYENTRTKGNGSGPKALNCERVRELEINLPPLAEQTEIVRRVEALFALADRIEARCTTARAQAQRLTPLVLAKAFRGELVPQDPNDEPVSELLVRIQLAKDEVSANPKKRKFIARKQAAR